MIELRDVSKFYRNICAVKDIHLTFRRGEIHALIGHTGAANPPLSPAGRNHTANHRPYLH